MSTKPMYVNIESERLSHGMTRRDVARILGISRDIYVAWILGDFPIPANKLYMLSKIFSCSVDILLCPYPVTKRLRDFHLVKLF